MYLTINLRQNKYPITAYPSLLEEYIYVSIQSRGTAFFSYFTTQLNCTQLDTLKGSKAWKHWENTFGTLANK
jgi:hypothetical protein